MERYAMFLDWKNRYCENDYTTQSNLQIQGNLYQITNGIFHKTRTKNFTICMEKPKTMNSQSNLEKEKRSWRNQASWLHTILQSYSNQDSMSNQDCAPHYWACALEPTSHNYWASVPQLLKPRRLEPMFCNQSSLHSEKPKHRNEE